MPEIVISNTSPLFYLHQIGHLDILQKLYTHIVVPEAVVAELEAGRAQGEDVPDVAACEWITIRSIAIPQLVSLITDLGAGEAEALALALQEPNSVVILDDYLAREIGRLQDVRITGTAGVILKAKQQGHLTAVKPLLDRLIQMNFRLSDSVKTEILKLAGEQ